MSGSTIFNSQQRLDLAALIKANDTDDCTEEIRSKKQSVLIKNDVKHGLGIYYFLEGEVFGGEWRQD